MKSAFPTWLLCLCSGALLFGCTRALQPPPTPAPATQAPEQAPTKPDDAALGFLAPGEQIDLPPQPDWREQACEYPDNWQGPEPGLIALYIAATPAEIRAANPDYRPPSEPRRDTPLSAEERRAAFMAGAGLARVNVEAIAGTEVSYLVGSDEAERRGALEVVLEGPEAFEIWRVAPRVVEQLAAVSDAQGFGDRWAATLTEAHEDPPESTDEQKRQTLEIAKRLGMNTHGRTVENFDDDYVGHQYEPALWQGVACELAQLARFAVRTGRELYLTQYLD